MNKYFFKHLLSFILSTVSFTETFNSFTSVNHYSPPTIGSYLPTSLTQTNHLNSFQLSSFLPSTLDSYAALTLQTSPICVARKNCFKIFQTLCCSLFSFTHTLCLTSSYLALFILVTPHIIFRGFMFTTKITILC